MITPPSWLGSEAQRHFEMHARYMNAVNDAYGFDFYNESDVDTLAKMSASHQKAMEYMAAESTAKDPRAAERAQRKRMAEDRNYQSFMKMLGLDPEGRLAVSKKAPRAGASSFYMRISDD